MTNPIKKIVVTVTPWPSEGIWPHHIGYQWDIEIDGEWWGGGTGPGSATDHVYYAIEHYLDNRDDC